MKVTCYCGAWMELDFDADTLKRQASYYFSQASNPKEYLWETALRLFWSSHIHAEVVTTTTTLTEPTE